MRSSDLSNGGMPVGSVFPIADSVGPIHTATGQDYLRTGVLAPIGIYSGLEFTHPYLTVNAASIIGQFSLTSMRGMWYTNGYYYASDNAGNAAYSTDLITWTLANSIPPSDSFVMGNYIVGFDATTTGAALLTTGTTPITIGTGMLCGASNPAGTLGIIGKNVASAASIFTSTNAVAWTSRTGSSGTSSTMIRACWNVPSSKFIYLVASGLAYTTPDGYTVTSAGSCGLTNISATNANNACPSDHSAYSTTSTMFTCVGTGPGGVVAPYLVKTANGTVFNATLISTLLGLDSRQQTAQPPRITYANGTWLLTISPLSGDPATSLCYKSTDDGVTWVKIPIPVNASYPTTALSVFKYLNNQYVSAVVSTTAKISAHGASLSATHVGIAQKSDSVTSGGATIPNYVRIR